jgi:hypothetical protein
MWSAHPDVLPTQDAIRFVEGILCHYFPTKLRDQKNITLEA